LLLVHSVNAPEDGVQEEKKGVHQNDDANVVKVSVEVWSVGG
jgi:hypothetical protein